MHYQISFFAFMFMPGITTESPIVHFNATLIERHDPTIATVYSQASGTGSCGHTHTDGSNIVAISSYFNSAKGSGYLCDRMVKITNTGPTVDQSIGGKGNVVYAKAADTCPSCDEDHLDLSWAAWNALTNGAGGSVVGMSWYFCNADGSC